MKKVILIASLLILLFDYSAYGMNSEDLLSNIDKQYSNKKYIEVISQLGSAIEAYELGNESFLDESTITQARNLIALSYLNLGQYSNASKCFALTIDGYSDPFASYCFELIRQVSIIEGERLNPDERYYTGGIDPLGHILINLLNGSSPSQRQKFFRNFYSKQQDKDWKLQLVKYCAGDSSLKELWSSVPKESFVTVNTYVGLMSEISGDLKQARELYSKSLGQKNSDNIELLLACNRMGLFTLKMIYSTKDMTGNVLTDVYSVKASSAKLEGKQLYSIRNLIDNDSKTTWVPNSKKSGIGEWAEVSFDDSTQVNSLTIVNGYAKSDVTFKNNNRIKTATLEFSDGSKQKITLKDTMQPQTIQIGKSTQKIRLTINEVYKGVKYDDTCLSGLDVQFKK